MALSLLLICLSSYLLASICGSCLFFFIIALGTIVLNIEILSLFRCISGGGIIILNIITFLTVLAFWAKKFREEKNAAFLKPDTKALKNTAGRVLNAFKLDKSLIILALGFVFLLAGAFILCAFLPVNDFDALDYHTYRALVWAEKGYILHFDTKDIRNLVMPINSELIYTWIFSLTKKDAGFGFLEFFSFIFGTVGLWTFLERLKITIRKRLWCIFIFSSFAGVISQISSTQTDLLVGVLLLYSMILFFDFINKENLPKENRGNIFSGYFSSLAFALALGVKSTAFMAGLALIVAFLIYSAKKKQVKKFALFAGFLAANFVIFSGYNYILNFIDYLNPLGSEISLNRHGFYGGFRGFLANFIRYNIQMFDFAGFLWGIYLSEGMFKIQNIIFHLLNIPAESGVLMKMEGLNSGLTEQIIGFGINGFLVFIPSVFAGVFLLIKDLKITGERTQERWGIIFSLGPLFYLCLIILSFAIGYMVYSIRFITAFVTICAPVLVLLYFRKNNPYKILVIVFCMFYMFMASGHLAARPLFKLVNLYKNEKSYEDFTNNVRCMNYDIFKTEKPGCKIDNALLPYIEKYKTVGFFADSNVLLHLTKMNASKKKISIEELIVPRFDNYNFDRYDYVITPFPSQPIDVYNKKDEKSAKEGNYPKDCYFRKNLAIDKVVKIECAVPYKKIENKGFVPAYNIRVGWKNLDNKDTFAQYIIWKKY